MNYITISQVRCVSCWSLQGRPHNAGCQYARFTLRASEPNA